MEDFNDVDVVGLENNDDCEDDDGEIADEVDGNDDDVIKLAIIIDAPLLNFYLN